MLASPFPIPFLSRGFEHICRKRVSLFRSWWIPFVRKEWSSSAYLLDRESRTYVHVFISLLAHYVRLDMYFILSVLDLWSAWKDFSYQLQRNSNKLCTRHHHQVLCLPKRYLLLLLFRCPAGKVEVTDNLTGLRHCTSSPCGHWTCRNGGTCVAQSQDKTICQCPEGYKGRWCEISQVKAGRPVGLSSGSILAISMCLLVFLGRNASPFFLSF